MIFRCVFILLGFPCSIRVRVIDDIFAFLASSVLLIIKDSLISLKWFVFIFFSPQTGLAIQTLNTGKAQRLCKEM